MKECQTHYFACDCREEMMLEICRKIIFMHRVQREAHGCAKTKCECSVCKTARKLYGAKLND